MKFNLIFFFLVSRTENIRTDEEISYYLINLILLLHNNSIITIRKEKLEIQKLLN